MQIFLFQGKSVGFPLRAEKRHSTALRRLPVCPECGVLQDLQNGRQLEPSAPESRQEQRVTDVHRLRIADLQIRQRSPVGRVY